MNDFEYDCWKKKQLARQAKYRKGNRRKCSLSTDNMTHKQWKERCGSVVSVNLNKPVAWDEFKKLSKQTKEEYVKGLVNTHGASMREVAEMFGVSYTTMYRHFKEIDMDMPRATSGPKKPGQKEKWQMFLSESGVLQQTAAPVEVVQEEESNSEEILEEIDVAAEANNAQIKDIRSEFEEIISRVSYDEYPRPVESIEDRLDEMKLSFGGDVGISKIVKALEFLMGENRCGSIDICIKFIQDVL